MNIELNIKVDSVAELNAVAQALSRLETVAKETVAKETVAEAVAVEALVVPPKPVAPAPAAKPATPKMPKVAEPTQEVVVEPQEVAVVKKEVSDRELIDAANAAAQKTGNQTALRTWLSKQPGLDNGATTLLKVTDRAYVLEIFTALGNGGISIEELP